jgi:glycosyltransferase involved in cell wall biosynthesis
VAQAISRGKVHHAFVGAVAVAAEDSVLGFMPRWIEVLAPYCSQLVAMCLFLGQYNPPAKVRVHSLGKEGGRSRFKYLWRLAQYLWQERNNYDYVLVHMNQEYVLVAGWWWWLTGKKVWLWRNHARGSWLTDVAVWWSQRVFCVSPQAYVARFAKAELMPAGIDTELFAPDPKDVREPRTLRYVGRVAPVKRVDLLLETATELAARGINFSLEIVGESPSWSAGSPIMLEHVKHLPAVRYTDLPAVYRTAGAIVNLTPAGSFDKVILEAMAYIYLYSVFYSSFPLDIK